MIKFQCNRVKFALEEAIQNALVMLQYGILLCQPTITAYKSGMSLLVLKINQESPCLGH